MEKGEWSEQKDGTKNAGSGGFMPSASGMRVSKDQRRDQAVAVPKDAVRFATCRKAQSKKERGEVE